ncbi:hypothetical protein [Streptomyces sp. HGB0020]|uniref:hypothetical protein n=1 Tax=Streptomyces sp. HGB0020 TaxID=1078086 RepID=UPI00055D86FA
MEMALPRFQGRPGPGRQASTDSRSAITSPSTLTSGRGLLDGGRPVADVRGADDAEAHLEREVLVAPLVDDALQPHRASGAGQVEDLHVRGGRGLLQDPGHGPGGGVVSAARRVGHHDAQSVEGPVPGAGPHVAGAGGERQQRAEDA